MEFLLYLGKTRPRSEWLQNAAALRRHGSDHPVRALKLCRRTLDIQVGAPAEFQRPHRVIRAVAALRSPLQVHFGVP